MTGDTPGPQWPGDAAPPEEMRASHLDRDRVADVLRVAAGDGRLTADELDQRLEQALTARTLGELAVLTRDLPAPGLAAGPSPLSAAQPGTLKDVIRISRQGGRTKRLGRWLVPPCIDVQVGWGHVTLDFTEAMLTQPVLRIDAEIGSGSLTLITRPGIDVDADGVATRSGRVKILAPWGPEEPVILRIVVSGTVGSGKIAAHPRRRPFWSA
jgi:DUF1707 SHOCT-like domain